MPSASPGISFIYAQNPISSSHWHPFKDLNHCSKLQLVHESLGVFLSVSKTVQAACNEKYKQQPVN